MRICGMKLRVLCVLLISIICPLIFFAGCDGEHIVGEENNKIACGGAAESRLKLYGRNDREAGADEFLNVMSGFMVKFTGTSLSAEMKSVPKRQNGSADAPKLTAWSVLVDGSTDPLERVMYVDNRDWEVQTIVSGLPYGEHTVKVFKTDDPLISSCFVRNYRTDGAFSSIQDEPTLRIECYGDSISSGGDNIPLAEGETYLGTDPKHCNGGATYIAYAAYELHAELNVFAEIGITLSGAGGVANIYSRLSPQRNVKWQMTSFIPDIVVIGLGTNDRRISSNMSDYIFTCERFIRDLSADYGDAEKRIQYILVHGFMDDGTPTIGERMQTVTDDLSAEGYKICRLQFAEAAIRAGSGRLDPADTAPYWNGHPLFAEHKAAGQILADNIRHLGY